MNGQPFGSSDATGGNEANSLGIVVSKLPNVQWRGLSTNRGVFNVTKPHPAEIVSVAGTGQWTAERH